MVFIEKKIDFEDIKVKKEAFKNSEKNYHLQ